MNAVADFSAGTVLDALESDDLAGATERIGASLSRGASIADVIDGVIAPVLVEIGRRWHRREWTVSRQHRATATIDAALAAIEARYPPRATNERGPLLMACAEDEWHSLPARLAAVRLRAAGHDVVFLGPSLPLRHIGAHLARIDATAFGLSCTLAGNLIGVRRCVEAAHAVGVPVVVGGAAFDNAERRAQSIGADATWGFDDIDAFLCAPRIRGTAASRGSQRSSIRTRREAIDLDVCLHSVVGAAMVEIALRYPPLAGLDRLAVGRMEKRMAHLVRSIAVSIDQNDPELFDEFLTWAEVGLEARAMPEVLLLALDSIQHVLRPTFPRATVLVRRAAAARRDR